MLRYLKKFTVYSSVIVAGQASRALDDAPFAGQDESEDAKGLLRLLSECEDAPRVPGTRRDASFVQIFGECIEPGRQYLRAPPRLRRPARRDRPSASQAPRQLRRHHLQQQDHRHDPDRDRPAHEPVEPASSPRVPRRSAGRATAPRPRRRIEHNKITGPIPTEIGLLTALTGLRVPPASPTPARRTSDPRRRRSLYNNKITGTFPHILCNVEKCMAKDGNDLVAPCGSFDCCDLGDGAPCLTPELLEDAVARAELAEARADQAEALCGETSDSGPTGDEIDPVYYTSGSEDSHIDFASSPRPRRATRRATAPRRRRYLPYNKIDGTIPTKIGQLAALTDLRVPPASPTPGAPRDRPSASQGPQLQPCPKSASKPSGGGSVAIIIPVVIAAVILLAAILYLVRKRRVAALQPNRQSSMPTIGGDDEAEVEA